MSHTADLINEVNSLETEIWDLASKVWKLSELGLEEKESSALEENYLKKNGFTISDKGIGGLDYSWIATWGSGTPVIGITVEFDALPNLGNEPVAEKTPRKDGNPHGHGCGHNLIGAGAICAAVALKKHLEKNHISATIKVFGCPAEELFTGKNFMAQAGAFNNLDACLHWHPFNKTTAFNAKTTAVSSMRIEFFGKTSHSGNEPWEGRSAAHATEIFLHGINTMREQMLPEARVHYLVEKLGEAMNIVPDYARLGVLFRGPNAENAARHMKWIEDIATGAALMTQTTAKFTNLSGCYNLLPNQVMSDRVMQHLSLLGAPKWTTEEQEFAKTLQRNGGYKESGLDTAVTPDLKGMAIGGSTDVGDISNIVPTMGIVTACWPLGIPAHTWAATASNGMSIGKKGMFRAAEAIALTGLDLITDKDFLAAAKKEFVERTGGKKYQSLCPANGSVLAAEHHALHADSHDAIQHL